MANNGSGVYLPRWFVAILTGMILSSTAAGFWWGIGVERRVDFIERTRSTSADDRALEDRMRNYHDSRTPPPRVEAAIEEVRQLRARVRELERGGNDDE